MRGGADEVERALRLELVQRNTLERGGAGDGSEEGDGLEHSDVESDLMATEHSIIFCRVRQTLFPPT